MAGKENPYKRAETREKVPPGGKPKVDPPAPTLVPVEPEAEETPTVVGKDFLAKFVEPKSEGKSYSFYLSNEAAKNLERLAKQLKCSKSKALDILLKNAVE
jgi:hypothetical protein